MKQRGGVPRLVLVAEDTADLREMWRLWLTVWGFEVIEAGNGAEALAQARTHHPDLVLMDLWMPVMDGIEAMRRLRSDPQTADIAIIALTAQSGPDVARRARDAGCDHFRVKPVLPQDLADLIHGSLAQKDARMT
jgi:CheY-like chemotaxis protein